MILPTASCLRQIMSARGSVIINVDMVAFFTCSVQVIKACTNNMLAEDVVPRGTFLP